MVKYKEKERVKSIPVNADLEIEIKKKLKKGKRKKKKTMQKKLEKRAEKIATLIKSGENDAAADLILKSMLSLLIKLIPIAENAYREQPKQGQAYALNNLISTARELAADLQATGDKQAVVDNIIFNVLTPTAQNIVSFLINENFNSKKLLASLVKDEKIKDANDLIDAATKNNVAYMKATLESIQERLTQTILGDK